MENRKVALTDSLVNSAAWTHNTNINRLGYTPLQLVIGKLCSLPDLMMGNEATESVSDMEAVQKVRERKLKNQVEFREAEVRMKIKD